jgi:predicted RNase H-like HicB family nuclease
VEVAHGEKQIDTAGSSFQNNYASCDDGEGTFPDAHISAYRRFQTPNNEAGVIMHKQLTAIIEREGDGYISLCPEVDIASQGDSIEEARDNLREALELFFEAASPGEIKQRFHEEVYPVSSS